MSLASKILSVGSNPAMLFACMRWVGAKLFFGRPSRHTLPGGAQIGEWLSFSEYWYFRNIIPKSERLFVEQCLDCKTAGGMAFDIGANVGGFTCLMASRGHTVHAFEPVPETFCRLKNNVKFNGLRSAVNAIKLTA